MKNHIPLRMCVACRDMKPKSELIRFVLQDNKVVIDADMKVQTRGAYLCRDKNCIALARKKRSLERCFKSDCADAYIQISNAMLEVDSNE